MHEAPWQPVYMSEDEAIARVEWLKPAGYWPGIRHTANGYELTYNPKLGTGVHRHRQSRYEHTAYVAARNRELGTVRSFSDRAERV